MPIKPRYVRIKRNEQNIWSFITDRKELEAQLENGSLKEGDIVYELKLKYRIVTWKDGRLLLEDVSHEEA